MSVLLDGTETASSLVPHHVRCDRLVLGVRVRVAGGMQFYRGSVEWPSSTGSAPNGVDGWETGTRRLRRA